MKITFKTYPKNVGKKVIAKIVTDVRTVTAWGDDEESAENAARAKLLLPVRSGSRQDRFINRKK